MSVLPIYLYGSEILRRKAKPVHDIDNSVIKLVYDMAETMRKANGIGLAAVQVGDSRRVIVVDLSAIEDSEREADETVSPGKGRERKTLALINPEVVEASGSWDMEEGCLSIPDVRAEVTRAQQVRVRFRDVNSRDVEMTLDGLLGRVVLHEINHLDGILFIDHISPTKRALLRSDLRRIKKGDVETSYPVVSAVEA
jgi:peptide deformylase